MISPSITVIFAVTFSPAISAVMVYLSSTLEKRAISNLPLAGILRLIEVPRSPVAGKPVTTWFGTSLTAASPERMTWLVGYPVMVTMKVFPLTTVSALTVIAGSVLMTVKV